MNKNNIFVYGTLKGKHKVSYVRDATLNDYTLYGVSNWFPGAVASEGHSVHGELHSVNDAELAGLDRYEGVPNLYTRERVTTADGTDTWVYVWAKDLDEFMPHIGDTWAE